MRNLIKCPSEWERGIRGGIPYLENESNKQMRGTFRRLQAYTAATRGVGYYDIGILHNRRRDI